MPQPRVEEMAIIDLRSSHRDGVLIIHILASMLRTPGESESLQGAIVRSHQPSKQVQLSRSHRRWARPLLNKDVGVNFSQRGEPPTVASHIK